MPASSRKRKTRSSSRGRRVVSEVKSPIPGPAGNLRNFGKTLSSLSLQHKQVHKKDLSKKPRKFLTDSPKQAAETCSKPGSEGTKVLHQETNPPPQDVDESHVADKPESVEKDQDVDMTQDVDKPQHWTHYVQQSIRSSMIDLIVPDIVKILGCEVGQALAFTQKVESHVFTAANSQDEYLELFATELGALETKHRKCSHQVSMKDVISHMEPPPLSPFPPEVMLTPSRSPPSSPPHLDLYPTLPPPAVIEGYASSSLPSFSSAFTPPTPSPTSSDCSAFGGETFLLAMTPVWTQIDEKDLPGSVQPKYLQAFRTKLESGAYADPWGFIEEVFTAVENAKMECAKRKAAYRYWTEVAEILDTNINQVMHDLGYCCGHRYKFDQKTYTCTEKGCLIKVGENYFCYEDKMAYCVTCFDKLPKKIPITVEKDDIITSSLFVKKSKFIEWTNNIVVPEPFVTCVSCGKKHHVICVRHFEHLSPNGFRCHQCRLTGVTWPLPRARNLPTTKLSSWIEDHVNGYLSTENLPLNIHVRVVASIKKVVKVQPEMLQTATEMPAALPYTAKSIFVFQDLGDSDVCFFAFYVQEYSSNCAGPNARRVYISYVDSVHFYEPKNHRSDVYKEILVGYLGYAKQLGFTCAHFWASPVPLETPDYIFSGHPPDQNMPRLDRIRKWYKSLSKRGEEYGIVMGLKSIEEYAKDMGMNDVSQLPYFEGDYWVGALEDIIKIQREEADANKTVKRKNDKMLGDVLDGKALWEKVRGEMELRKNVFFVTLLNPENHVEPHLIVDTDELIPCEVMENRENFIDFCREKHYEFSSLRRAKYSTMAIVDEILRYLAMTCNGCGLRISTWFHCTVCADFDLCNLCNEITGHKHLLEKVVVGEETVLEFAGCPPVEERNGQSTQPTEFMRLQASRLAHAYRCHLASCDFFNCVEIQQNRKHHETCTNPECTECEELTTSIQIHAVDCDEGFRCPVTNCYNVKQQQFWSK